MQKLFRTIMNSNMTDLHWFSLFVLDLFKVIQQQLELDMEQQTGSK